MATSINYELEGIVIRASQYMESSKILTLFTRKKGIIPVMAKGVKRPKSKMQNLTGNLSRAKFILRRRDDFYYLQDGEIIDLFMELRTDIKNIYFVQLALDFVEKNILSGESNEIIYDMTVKFMSRIAACTRKLDLFNMFVMKLLAMLGYKPNLSFCTLCGNALGERMYFDMEAGGLVCGDCKNLSRFDRIEERDRLYLYRLLTSSFDAFDELDPDVDSKRIFKILTDFLFYTTEIYKPKSYFVLCNLIGVN
ncbi:DNA repair protein RecO [Peptoniphilaceae bacterium SGI.131]